MMATMVAMTKKGHAILVFSWEGARERQVLVTCMSPACANIGGNAHSIALVMCKAALGFELAWPLIAWACSRIGLQPKSCHA